MIVNYLLLIIFLSIPMYCYGGLKIESIIYGLGEEVRERTVTYVDNSYIKIENSDGKYKLIDLDKRMMFEIDPERKEYVYDTLDNIAKDLRDENKKVKESLRKHSVEFDQSGLRIFHPSPIIKVNKTNVVMLIAGLKTTKYEVYVDKKLYQEIWITKGIELGRSFKYKNFLKWKQELHELITDDSPGCYVNLECNKLFREGLQMKIIQYGWCNMMVPQVEEVTNVIRINVPKKEFRISKPKGYKKVTPHIFYWAN